jgi:DNA-binding IclR family transcriptional regulator
MRRQYQLMERTLSGVGVLDKSMAVLSAVAGADAALGLSELVVATGLSRATTHRLAVALEAHGVLRRDAEGRFALGLRLLGLGRAAGARWPVVDAARPALEWLRATTGESVQLYVRDGLSRVCVDSLDSPNELRTIVDVGARLPLDAGSAGRILLDDCGDERGDHRGESTSNRRRWVQSVEERAPGVASVSAPVHGPGGVVVAAVGISGPIERTTRDPGRKYGKSVVDAAGRIDRAIAHG